MMRRRVATLAPYTLSDKGPLSLNLRMQSVRPTLATESSTADEPLLLRETKLREHKAASSRPVPRRRSSAPDVRLAQQPSSSTHCDAECARWHAAVDSAAGPGGPLPEDAADG